MIINLDKTDLIFLVMGTTPHYDIFENPLVKPFGRYNASYGTWSWDGDLESLQEQELYNLYILCKNSGF